MKSVILLAACATACATDNAESPTAPYYTTFPCTLAAAHLACDLGFTDPDGDFTRIQFDIVEGIGTEYEFPPRELPDLAGMTEGALHFELDLAPQPTSDLYVSVYMFDATGHWSWVHSPVIHVP